MTLKTTILQIQNINGTIYDFPEIDDILPEHSHGPNDAHISIVARGKFLIKFGNNKKEATAGDVYNWPVGEPHEFISLEPNSRLINIIKQIKDAPSKK